MFRLQLAVRRKIDATQHKTLEIVQTPDFLIGRQMTESEGVMVKLVNTDSLADFGL